MIYFFRWFFVQKFNPRTLYTNAWPESRMVNENEKRKRFVHLERQINPRIFQFSNNWNTFIVQTIRYQRIKYWMNGNNFRKISDHLFGFSMIHCPQFQINSNIYNLNSPFLWTFLFVTSICLLFIIHGDGDGDGDLIVEKLPFRHRFLIFISIYLVKPYQFGRNNFFFSLSRVQFNLLLHNIIKN